MGVRVSRNWTVTALLSALLLLAAGPSSAWVQAEPPAHAQSAQPAPAQAEPPAHAQSAQPAPAQAESPAHVQSAPPASAQAESPAHVQSAPPASAQGPSGHPVDSPATAHGAAAEGHDSGGLVPTIARLVNFALLAGTLIYFLRSPTANYLRSRKEQIRSDLVKAKEMRTAAAAQIAEIEQRMNALPAELDALRKSGAEEVVAEEARMRQAANAERSRFLEQARREIDAHLKLAERELVKHAADLAVAIAAERIKKTITAADQTRLVDRYLTQVGRSSAMTS